MKRLRNEQRLTSDDGSTTHSILERDNADLEGARGDEQKATRRPPQSSNTYLQHVKYLPPIPCTIKMLTDGSVVQRAGRSRVRFPSFAGWRRQYHKVTIVGRVVSVEVGSAASSRQHDAEDSSDEDDAGMYDKFGDDTFDDDVGVGSARHRRSSGRMDTGRSASRQLIRDKKRPTAAPRRAGGAFTTLVICDSTGQIEIRVAHPPHTADPTPHNTVNMLPSWEAVMAGHPHHVTRSPEPNRWQLTILPGDFVCCTAAIRLRRAYEGGPVSHEGCHVVSAGAAEGAAYARAETPAAAASSSLMIDAESGHSCGAAPPMSSCVSHLLIASTPTDVLSGEEDANLMLVDPDRRQRLVAHGDPCGGDPHHRRGDRWFFRPSACRVILDVSEVTFHALTVVVCVLRTKAKVMAEKTPAPIHDHLLGPPLDDIAVLLPIPKKAEAIPDASIVEGQRLRGEVSFSHATDNPTHQRSEDVPPPRLSAGVVRDVEATAPPHQLAAFDPSLLVTFAATAPMERQTLLSSSPLSDPQPPPPVAPKSQRSLRMSSAEDAVRGVFTTHRRRLSAGTSSPHGDPLFPLDALGSRDAGPDAFYVGLSPLSSPPPTPPPVVPPASTLLPPSHSFYASAPHFQTGPMGSCEDSYLPPSYEAPYELPSPPHRRRYAHHDHHNYRHVTTAMHTLGNEGNEGSARYANPYHNGIADPHGGVLHRHHPPYPHHHHLHHHHHLWPRQQAPHGGGLHVEEGAVHVGEANFARRPGVMQHHPNHRHVPTAQHAPPYTTNLVPPQVSYRPQQIYAPPPSRATVFPTEAHLPWLPEQHHHRHRPPTSFPLNQHHEHNFHNHAPAGFRTFHA